MLHTLWPILVFVPFFLVLILRGMQQRSCPECGGPLHGFQSPWTKTRRQWVEGGYLCGRCGCECDVTGAKIVSGTGYSRAALIAGIALIVAAVAPAIALGVFLLRHSV